MPPKLTYFSGKGRCELLRLILAYGEVEYEDIRITFETWPSIKPTSPLGFIPMMTLENGNTYSQSVPLARYYANKFGLCGHTDEERLHGDMIVDVLTVDTVPLFARVFFEKDEEKKAALKADAQTKVTSWFQSIEGRVQGENTFLGKASFDPESIH